MASRRRRRRRPRAGDGARRGRDARRRDSSRADRCRCDEALEIAGQIAEALEAAHEEASSTATSSRRTSRSRRDGIVKVLDFGLAKRCDAGPRERSIRRRLDRESTTRRPILGTPAYMSPEQARGRPSSAYRHLGVWLRALRDAHRPPRLRRRNDDRRRSRTSSIASRIGRCCRRRRRQRCGDSSKRVLVKDARRRLRSISDARMQPVSPRTKQWTVLPDEPRQSSQARWFRVSLRPCWSGQLPGSPWACGSALRRHRRWRRPSA